MTANRFQKVSQYFHVSDRDSEPVRGSRDYDRLYKIRPVLDHVSENFLERYDVGSNVSVNEAMIRYTGKLSFCQYMPAKPIKRGIKVWMACDSTSAYLFRFEVYLGRTGNQPEHGLGLRVVTTLSDHLQQSHRCVYFDNFFTGVQLMEDLLDNGLYGCGTVRVNRKGFPAELKKPHAIQERGDFVVMQKGDLTATAWRDK
ncbi:piggyBac transposable element-derived protein 1-like [Mercenaria mercenaria]|uniref:piggyBac transposable element-derived protein 1-like n=1 Tax=Mercenaria mercenaria TaxID=6596 RepID=UPI00234F631C|nr:piggyBac transposable element-derived protein 1-like [Mercenaria mercenaria]